MTLWAFAIVGPAIGSPKAIVAAVSQKTNELRMSFPIRTPERARASAYREEDRSAKPDSPVMSDRYIRSGAQRNAVERKLCHRLLMWRWFV
jgi:hypothetical protein